MNVIQYLYCLIIQMKKVIMILFVLFFITINAQQDEPVVVQKDQSTITRNIDSNWTLTVLSGPSQANSIKDIEYAVNLPTTLHLDLLKNKVIEDPFFSANYPTVQWVSDCKIKYTKLLRLQDSLLQRQEIQLIFQGIDTYSTIILNGQELKKTSNAFQQYVINVNGKLKNQNKLQVIIEPTRAHDDEGQRQNNMPFKYAHTRKACYQYSWDWAPMLNTIGIWKSVSLRIYDKVRFNYVWVRNKMLSNEQATINFAAQLTTNPYGEQTKYSHKMAVFLNNQKLQQVNLSQQTAYLDVAISNPKLWWPNGIGQPFIYDFVVKLMKEDTVLEERKIPFGIKTVELNLKDKKFQVIVNGYPIYCKGANYVPPDMFYPRITNQEHNPQNSFKQLIDDAVESNFNMLRLWGGGQYESDEFLELASRKGIMIFYDFMFSDSIYPSTQNFLLSVEEEIKQQIRRARNYPCLALWCGNNEILQGINDWGWSRNNYRNDYKLLFETLIKRVIEIESPYIPYIPSSPIYGVGNYGFDRGGDIHYWGVWAGGSPFQSYENAIGPFNSQFGTQAIPVWQTVKQFTKENERNYDANGFQIHERHGSRFGTLRNYMKMYMKPSENFEKQTYQSGLVQAYGMEIAIRAQRAAKPKSYGTLYWQFNDAWPAISWSSIDYYGRWKPLQYMAKRMYTNIAIFCLKNNEIIGINDNLYDVNVRVKIQLMTFDGQILVNQTQERKISADSTQKLFTLRLKQEYKQEQTFVYCEIAYKNKVQMASTYFFKPFKNLELPQATLKVEYKVQQNQITLSSDKLIKNLYIYNSKEYVKLSDNYFDLVPNVPVTVTLQGCRLADVKSNMKYMSVRQSSSAQELKVTE